MEAWQIAVSAIADRARLDRGEAVERLRQTLDTDHTVDDADRLRSVGRITLNFHPDRIASDGRTVAAGLRHQGRYRSQWVTWISNGGRSAISGGDRDRWERALFGTAYDGCDPSEVEFPLYGALDVLRDPMGGSPRFGSCYLVLADHVADRTTFCVGDSHVGPDDVGTTGEMLSILAGLAVQADCGRLLNRDLETSDLIEILDGEYATERPGRELDGYVEAQVHGGVELATDAVAIVADPSFRDTRTGNDLSQVATVNGLELMWHSGSQLPVADVPADFRGPTMPDLAAEIADGSATIDAASIGRAAQSIVASEPTVDGDAGDSPAQQLKRLWHCLLAFGADAEST